jgi:hypothetical protein
MFLIIRSCRFECLDDIKLPCLFKLIRFEQFDKFPEKVANGFDIRFSRSEYGDPLCRRNIHRRKFSRLEQIRCGLGEIIPLLDD